MTVKMKSLIKKLYRLINILPFNNLIRLKGTKLQNKGKILYRCRVISQGNNTVILHKGGVIRNTVFHIQGNNNIIEIGEGTSINQGDIWIEDDNNQIIIGDNTNLCGKIHLACTEGCKIRIGNNCLFSSEIVFRTGDSHSIVDMSGERINRAADIIIGNHVWIGHRVLVNKGVVIPENTVVGTGAVVTKQFDEPNTIIVGVPAKVSKQNINWLAERI